MERDLDPEIREKEATGDHVFHIPVSVTKSTPPEKKTWEEWLSEHQIRGRITVSAAGLQGKDSHRRSVCFTDTGLRFIV